LRLQGAQLQFDAGGQLFGISFGLDADFTLQMRDARHQKRRTHEDEGQCRCQCQQRAEIDVQAPFAG